ncbi:MAG: monovalent cation/H+ antiporter complex subunit F [Promicromonosporaceae bacterium]|nr:monovalent cation/H+ antiporter complex subunit F [Promicromonosporaceae bacterium]
MFLTVISYILLTASVATAAVALRGRDPWARLLGYTLVASKVNMLVIVLALATGMSFYLDIALVYIVLSYIGVLVLADYMSGRGRADDAPNETGRDDD